MSGTRLRKTALLALTLTILLVAVGGFTRGSGSGYGCSDRWPLCEGGGLGGLVPRWEYNMVIEWSHRWLASVVGLVVLATAVLAWRERRERHGVVVPTVAAVGFVAVQAYVGRMVVQQDLDADLVSVHLAIAMVVVALLTITVVNSAPPTAAVHTERSWVLKLGSGAAITIVVLLLGSYVHNRYVPGWPLVDGQLFPDLSDRYVAVHYAHRVAAALGLFYVIYLAVAASRLDRPRAEVLLLYGAVAGYVGNALLGAVHVATKVSSSVAVVTHLTLAAVAWMLLVWVTVLAANSRRRARSSGSEHALPVA